jgi:signal peptidase I
MKLSNKNKTTDTVKEQEEEKVRQSGSLRERLARVKKSRWIRFGIVSVIFFAWVAWLGNWWVALAWFLLADIYLTQFIPWNWWKFSKNKVVRTIMSWVDAIVYALVLVYFLFIFVGQNYQIPSSSLEKTLLTGDFLWVNKMVYGPRVPQTPLHFPLAQNELFGFKSYIDKPQLEYHRLKGLRNIERGDIVVFNFPAGDTVVLDKPNPDYYSQVFQDGRDAVWNNHQVIYRPVDRRDNYVKRCVGLPGEMLQLVGGKVVINGKTIPEPKNVQYNYAVKYTGTPDYDFLTNELGVTNEDIERNVAVDQITGQQFIATELFLPLTAAMKAQLEKCSWVNSVERVQYGPSEGAYTYPIGVDYGWTHNDYGPIWIPKKGATIALNEKNLQLYGRCIKDYEGNNLEIKGGKAYIDGKPASRYTFKMDYYWMMGDNRDNSLDSRFWGFVPEDHIVGTPMFVIISFDKDRPLLQGGIRWNRIFTDANPDK